MRPVLSCFAIVGRFCVGYGQASPQATQEITCGMDKCDRSAIAALAGVLIIALAATLRGALFGRGA